MEKYLNPSAPEGSKPQTIYLGHVQVCTVEMLALPSF